MYPVSCSVKPKPREREYVVPLIRQNRWRPPAKKGGEGSRQGEGKSAEEVALEKEAAEAIMKGELHFLSTCSFVPFSLSLSLPLFLPLSFLLSLSLSPFLPPSLPSSLPLSLSQTFRRPSYMDWSRKTVVLWYLS